MNVNPCISRSWMICRSISIVLLFGRGANLLLGDDWILTMTQSDYRNYQRILAKSSENDYWDQTFGCSSSPYSIQMLYKRNKEFVGLLKCSGGPVWVSSIGLSAVSVGVNAPLDLRLPTPTVPTTTASTTTPLPTTVAPSTTTTAVTTTPVPVTVAPAPTAVKPVTSKTTPSKKPNKSVAVVTTKPKDDTKPSRTSPNGSKDGSNSNKGKTAAPSKILKVISTPGNSVVTTPTVPMTTLSASDEFLAMLSQSSSAVRNACKQWNVLSSKTINSTSNFNFPSKVVKAQCADDVLPVTLYFTFDVGNNPSPQPAAKSYLNYRLTSYNETQNVINVPTSVFPSPYWQEMRQEVLQYFATDYPKGVADIVGQQCSRKNVTWISLYANVNNGTTFYTKVICSVTLQTQFYVRSYTPEEADPILIDIYIDRPYYVQEVYKSVFSIYRTINSKGDEMKRVLRDLKLMQNNITQKLGQLGCNSKTYSTLAVHGDPKMTSKSYFVEMTCNNKMYYLEYEKPDDAQTRTFLESMDKAPVDLSNAQNLLHKSWSMSYVTFDSKTLLKSTVNFKEAAQKVSCSDYQIVLTYEKVITAKQQKFYLVIIYCPSNPNNPIAYVTVFTLLKSDWFKPCLADNIRFYPPDDF